MLLSEFEDVETIGGLTAVILLIDKIIEGEKELKRNDVFKLELIRKNINEYRTNILLEQGIE